MYEIRYSRPFASPFFLPILFYLHCRSLYDNNLQSLSKGTFDSLKSIEYLHLGQNPFICDCHMRWLAKFLKKNPVETSGARCVGPPKVANKEIAEMKPKRYRCSSSKYHII